MHRSGIVCDQDIKDQFIEAEDDDEVLYMIVSIQDEKFVKTGDGKRGKDQKENFELIGKALGKEACYVLMKTPVQGKWLLIYYIPASAKVKSKMLTASSFADLKSGLGSAKFVGEYPITEVQECTWDEYQGSIKDDTESVMTWQERDAKESAYEHSALTETKVSAVVGLPIPVDDSGTKALDDFLSGEVDTIIFVLDQEKETLGAGESAKCKFDEIVGKLPEREPRYVLHNFTHERDGITLTKPIFVYYCPDKSKPRLRMFYATAKSNVLTSIDEHKIPEPKRIEISLSTDLTSHSVMDELYPKSAVKKVFKKPTRQGKGRSKFMGKKFTPS